MKLISLRSRAQFLAAAQTSFRYVCASVVIQVKPWSSEGPFLSSLADREVLRVGFTASRKVGGAVQRNRSKRRLREAARHVLSSMNIRRCDIVFIAREKTASCAFEVLKEDIHRGLLHATKSIKS